MRFLVFHCSIWNSYVFFQLDQWELMVFCLSWETNFLVWWFLVGGLETYVKAVFLGDFPLVGEVVLFE